MNKSQNRRELVAKPTALWQRLGRWLDSWAYTRKPNDTANWQSKQETLQRLKQSHKQ